MKTTIVRVLAIVLVSFGLVGTAQADVNYRDLQDGWREWQSTREGEMQAVWVSKGGQAAGGLPDLTILCTANRTRLSVIFNNNDPGRNLQSAFRGVTVSVDSAEQADWRWAGPKDQWDSSIELQTPVPHLRNLIDKKRLSVRVSANYYLDLSLAGLENALTNIRRYCNW